MKAFVWMGMAAAALGWVAAPVAPAVRTTDQVGCRVELDRGVLPAGAPQRAVVKVTLDAPAAPRRGERPPVNLALVLDRSGSMSGEKIEKAKEAAIAALRRLGAEDLFSLVIYDHEVETLVSARSAGETEYIEPRIRGIASRGNTALFGGVSQGAAEVRRNAGKRYINRILLLSDGLANVGPSQPEDLGRLGAALQKEGISVSTIGVGTDYNEDLMTRLSQQSDGNSYFVETSADLPRIFAAELGDVLSVVAKKVVIEIVFPEGVRPVRIIGRDGRLAERRAEIRLNQLYGGQEKYALIEVEVDPGRPRDVRCVAEARCTYENAVHNRQETASGRAEARFSEDEAVVIQSANGEVQRELMYNWIAEAKDRAVDLADQGKNEAAARELREVEQRARQQAARYNVNDEKLDKDLEGMAAAAPSVSKEGFDKAGRKAFRTDSYQERNQQQQR